MAMNPINRTLFNALARKRSVGISGCGTLSVRSVSCTVRDGQVTAPVCTVVFSPEESGEVSLCSLVARASGVSEETAARKVERWLAAARGSGGNSVFIEGVAEVVRQENGKYTVIPSNALNNLLNPFEQWSYPLPALRKEATAVPVKLAAGKKNRRPVYAAAGILVFLLAAGAYFFLTEYDASSGAGGESASVSVPLDVPAQPFVEPPVEVSVTPPAIDTAAGTQDSEALSPSSPVPSETTAAAVTDPAEYYHVISGVFSTLENARRHIAQNEFGNAAIIPTTGERFMVSIGRFTEKKDADAMVRELSRKYPELWVSKRRE